MEDLADVGQTQWRRTRLSIKHGLHLASRAGREAVRGRLVGVDEDDLHFLLAVEVGLVGENQLGVCCV